MKRLAFLLMLIPSLAFAQVGPEVYKPVTGAQIINFTSGTPFTITSPMTRQMARIVCSAACYISINPTGHLNLVTSTTGIYIPADVPQIFVISRNSKISVLGFSGSGTMNVLELSK